MYNVSILIKPYSAQIIVLSNGSPDKDIQTLHCSTAYQAVL